MFNFTGSQLFQFFLCFSPLQNLVLAETRRSDRPWGMELVPTRQSPGPRTAVRWTSVLRKELSSIKLRRNRARIQYLK